MASKLRKLRFLQIILKTIRFLTMVNQYSHITMKHACRLKLTRHFFSHLFIAHFHFFKSSRRPRRNKATVVNLSTEKQKQELNLHKYLHDRVVPLGLAIE